MDKKIFHCFYYDLDIGALSPVKDSIFDYLKDYSALYLDCGRSSLRAIGSLFGEGEILVPDYTCASVIQSFIPPLKQKYYHINDDFTIDFDSLESLITPEVKLICVSQFCGKLLPKDQVKRLIEIRNKYGIKLIEDTTHSILSSPLTFGDYGACALYKWFPSSSGGVCYSREQLDSSIYNNLRERQVPKRIYSMLMHSMYNKGYMEYSDKIDEFFDSFDPELTLASDTETTYAKMPALDEFILKCCSVSENQRIRKENARTLEKEINFDIVKPVFKELTDDDCLLAYPLYTKNRDSLREYLKAHDIFVPVYWNMDKLTQINNVKETVERSRNIIVIPVNQQYDKVDMSRVARVINQWQKEQI